MFSFLFCGGGGGDVDDGLEVMKIWLVSVKSSKRRNIPVDSSRLNLGIICIVIFACVRWLRAFNGTQSIGGLDNGDRWDGSEDWGLFSSSG